jgi:3-oxoacyl-[acyl-carrier protein] reductase
LVKRDGKAVNRRLAIVTGGGSGIGRHLVGALADAGYAVAASDRSAIEIDGDHIFTAACDVGIKAEVDAFVAAACGWHGGPPDLLVNNAGIQTWSPLLDLAEADWDAVIRTNLKGCFLNTQAVARVMREAGRGGAIVNIGSGCNKLAFPRLVDYTASKGGIEQFTKAAAVELGPLAITVNCVAPGAIRTERTAGESADYDAEWSRITPLGRPGTPADLVGAVLFFAGPGAAFVTGQTLWVDGGAFTHANWPYSGGA